MVLVLMAMALFLHAAMVLRHGSFMQPWFHGTVPPCSLGSGSGGGGSGSSSSGSGWAMVPVVVVPAELCFGKSHAVHHRIYAFTCTWSSL